MKKLTTLFVIALFLFNLAGCSQTLSSSQAEPDGQAFIDFMQSTHFSAWVRGDADTAQIAFSDELGFWNAQGLLCNTRKFYNDNHYKKTTTDKEGIAYFQADEINTVSEDVLGYAYPFWDNTTSGAKQENMLYEISLSFNKAEGLNDSVKLDTLTIKDGQLLVDCDVSVVAADTGTLLEWTTQYTFDYMPQNKYIPYRFISSKVIAGIQAR